MTAPAFDLGKALALLEEILAESTGLHWLDLDKLMELWGFVVEDYQSGKGSRYRIRKHPQFPDLKVAIPIQERVNSPVVHVVLETITRLRARIRN